MAVNVVIPLLIPLEANLHNATRLLSGPGSGPLEFTHPRYCVTLPEDTHVAALVANVTALHNTGAGVRYSITGGNRDGLFTIQKHNGLITLAAALDYETHAHHELVVAAEASGVLVHALVLVRVLDVNDNPPYFVTSDLKATVIEEDDRDLPLPLAKVEAHDRDLVDQGRLHYSVAGDGVDGFAANDVFFAIDATTGQLLQVRALDRDPPDGRKIWRVKVQVRDGRYGDLVSSRGQWTEEEEEEDVMMEGEGWKRKREDQHSPRAYRLRRRHGGGRGGRGDEEGGGEGDAINTGEGKDSTLLELGDGGGRKNGEINEGQAGTGGKETGRKGKIKSTKRRGKREKRKTPRDVGGKEGRRRNGERKSQRDRDSPLALGSEESNDHALVPFTFRVTKPRRSRRRTNEYEMGEWGEEGSNGGEGEEEEEEGEAVIEEGGDEEESGEEKEGGEEQEETREHRKTEEPLMTTIKEGIFRRRKGAELKTRNGEQKESTTNGIKGLGRSGYLASSENSFQTPKTGIHRPEEHLRTRRADTDFDLDYHDSPEHNRIKRTTPRADILMADDPNDDPALKMLTEITHCYDLTYAQDDAEREGWWFDDSRGGGSTAREKVHVAETVVTVLVKDINDNAPVFPNATMFGKVRENGEPGLPVAVVGAWDADDATEGTNARLTYAIEKNVIQEESGEAIFTVEPLTGEVTTALCCLDRETTPEYSIQVVASDGGGLKGTGTVVVVVTDVNDNSPRLARQLWQAEVDETWGLRPPNASQTLLEVSVSDQDTSNLFFYRIVEGSGLGWDHFGIRAEGGVGKLFARKTLDYENDAHREQGFRFLVQVTDQGEGSWDDPAHIDSAWAVITLRDLNDNPPQFSRPHAHVTMREDMAPGTLLASFPAMDFDMGGQQPVTYHVEGGRGALTVDGGGRVSLLRQLDREAAGDDGGRGGGASVVAALVVAVDSGLPPAPLSATATLSVTLEDVNDCAPRLLPPTTLRVTEGAPAALLGTLTATDDDVWALGHGPPFNFSLAPSNPAHVKAAIRLVFDQRIDSGRGGAEVWTVGALDREEHRQLKVGVLLSDAGGLSAVHALTIIVDDINDNPMRPGAKTVYLWKTQGLGSEAPLGRVYVDDPDDWDGRDKEYAWAAHPHPLFTLHPATGHIVASGQLREGRYDLHFSVSDRKWTQKGVGANVTVLVRFLTPEALAHATPLLLTPVTPMQLTKGWTPIEGHIRGGLGRLSTGVLQALGGQEAAHNHAVEVVSVYGRGDTQASRTPPTHESSLPPTTCVWVSVRKEGGDYVDPIKLAGILELHAYKLGSSMNLTVRVGDLNPSVEPQDFPARHDPLLTAHDHPSSAASLASTTLPLQVVDTNATALVTPRLTRSLDCRPRPHAHGDGSCTPSCLNGGRCVRQPYGTDRCICPGGSFGSRCKIPARSFRGTGWAWVAPLPPCLPATLSFRVLTNRPRALLLYSGPLSTPATSPRSLLALQLEDGRPRLIYEGRAGKVDLLVNTKVDDGAWHSIYAHFGTKGVVVMVDLCGRGWKDHDDHDDPRSSERNDHGDGHEHCLARAPWRNRKDRTRKGEATPSAPWLGVEPLQVGGMARTPSRPRASAGPPFSRLVTEGLDGCVAHLVINSQLVDLGEPPYSHASSPGCRPQEEACMGVLGESCGLRGACEGGLKSPRCECEPGWTGDGCSTPTVPALLGASSYMKVALSFTPTTPPEGEGTAVGVQLRVRTRGARDGLLIQLSSHHRRATFSLHLRAGVACASMGGAGWAARAACVEGRPLGDGAWHTVWAERHGHNLVVGVDDGDAGNGNASIHPAFLALPDGDEGGGALPPPPAPLLVDKHDGVTVGGIPEFVGVNLVTVHDDLSDTCVEDIRVSGRPLPLPPAVNGTRWGQVTTLEHLEKGCDPPDPCLRTNCNPPLSCHANWDRATCSCGPGRQLVGRTCEDVDECTWQPCLHGGTCENRQPGYVCTCGPDHVGEQCQWAKLPPPHAAGGHPLTAPAAVVALTVSVLILVVLGVVFTIRLHRRRSSRGWAGEGGGNGEGRLKVVKVEAGDKGRKKKRKKILSQRSSRTSGKGRLKKNQDEAGDKEEEDDEEEEEEEEKAAGRERQEACGLTTGLAAAAAVKGDAAHQTFLELLRLKVPAAEAGLQKTDTDDGASLPVPSCLLGRDAGQHQHHLSSADDHNHDRCKSSSSSLQTSVLSSEGSDPVKIFGGSAASHFLPGCLGAMDLLRNLPEGVTTTTWPTKCPEHQLRRSTTCPIALQCPGSHGLPRSNPIDGSTCSTSIARPVESSCSSLRKRPKGDSTRGFYKQSTEGSTCGVLATKTDGSTSVNLQENNPSEIRSLNSQPTGGIITPIPSSVIVSGASSATSITTC